MGRWINRDPIEEFGFKNQTQKKYLGKDSNNLFLFVQNNPVGNIDLFGLSEYNVYWNYESISIGAPVGVGLAKIAGTVISMKKSCDEICSGTYKAIKFKGVFGGGSLGSPIGGNYNNQEIFEDRYNDPDVHRVRGKSWLLSGTIAIHKWGKSGGGYHFGELHGMNTDVSNIDQGYDLGIDYVGGYTWTVGEVFCVESPFL